MADGDDLVMVLQGGKQRGAAPSQLRRVRAEPGLDGPLQARMTSGVAGVGVVGAKAQAGLKISLLLGRRDSGRCQRREVLGEATQDPIPHGGELTLSIY